jgi:uncharacterized protein
VPLACSTPARRHRARVSVAAGPLDEDAAAARLRSLVEEWAAARRADDHTAIRKLRSLGDQGDVGAQMRLGMIYGEGLYEGQSVEKDQVEAAKWIRKAADQGHKGAQLNLGNRYSEGRGVPQDFAQAASWFKRSAESGHPYALIKLALMYDEGKGLKQDCEKAISFYEKAAAYDAWHSFQIDKIYEKGTNCIDCAKSTEWFYRLANKGEWPAQQILGRRYAEGTCVLKNYIQAHMWLNLASSQISDERVRTQLRNCEKS